MTSQPKLRRFQRQFIRGVTGPGIDTAALSIPRGNGKSWLAAQLVVRVLTPGDPLYVQGAESVLCAASIEQARIVFRFARAALEPLGEYRFLDSSTRCAITHKVTNTRLRVVGSKGKTAMGLVNCPVAICDEPGSWETIGGQLMHDAIQTAQGKPGSPLRAIYIGTLAPAMGGWWPELIAGGSGGSTYVQALQGDPKAWDQWQTIRKANPLTAISAAFRKKLLEERDAARRDSRLKARFLSYRLNVPTADESELLLTVDDWELLTKREVPPRSGRPIVGIDLGGGRAWSAATAVWESGRVEALALAPGIPSIADQERRDRVPSGTYQKLIETGALRIADGLRVPPVADLVAAVRDNWGRPANYVCDRFRIGELQDAVGKAAPIVARVTRWSEASFDIRALRKFATDGPFSVAEISRPLLAASLSATMVKNDDQGSVRLVKKGSNNQARDDVSAAFTLAAGSYERANSGQRRPRARYLGMAG